MNYLQLITTIYYSSQTTTDDSALNIVFGINTEQQQFWNDKFSKKSATETWIFIFDFTWNTREALIINSINDIFRNKFFISSNAKIYVMTNKESLKMFEIYKKASNKYLTINQICDYKKTQQEWKKANQLNKWNRRYDLDGVDLLVGYISCPFVFMNDKVQ